MLQTFLNSFKLRNPGKTDMERVAEERIIDAGSGVRLQGFHSAVKGEPRGLVILIHGWEGSAGSAYIINTGRYLYCQGFDIFRLNLRDHGASHHLNEGLFYGTLIDETHAAVKEAAKSLQGESRFSHGVFHGSEFRPAGREQALR